MWKLERDRLRLSYVECSVWWREKDTIWRYISTGRIKDVLFNEGFFILLYSLFFAFEGTVRNVTVAVNLYCNKSFHNSSSITC